MGRAVVVVAILAAGCGRLGFGDVPPPDAAPVDVVAGHDEDGDGTPDVVDLCPHLADGGGDADSDGVGDACDPQPMTPGETYLVSAMFTPGDHPFATLGQFVEGADSLDFSGSGGVLVTDVSVTSVHVELGFDIGAIVGNGQHQIAVGLEAENQPFYFVELNENGTVKNAAIASYDPTNGYVYLGSEDHLGMHAGRGVIRFDALAGAKQIDLETGWTGETYLVGGSAAQYAGGRAVRIVVNGLDVSLRYLVVIARGG